MKTIIGLVRLFIIIAPLAVGYMTISDFLMHNDQPLTERTKTCRELKRLAVCVLLLILIPAEFVYTVFTHPAPDGNYIMNARYTISIYNEDTSFSKIACGTAPITVHIENEEYFLDDGERPWGNTKTIHYTNVMVSNITLAYFDNSKFTVNRELEEALPCDFDVKYNGNEYYVELEVDEITDKALNYSIEDRINDISAMDIFWSAALLLLDIVGIAGYFIATSIYKKEQTQKNISM